MILYLQRVSVEIGEDLRIEKSFRDSYLILDTLNILNLKLFYIYVFIERKIILIQLKFEIQFVYYKLI